MNFIFFVFKPLKRLRVAFLLLAPLKGGLKRAERTQQGGFKVGSGRCDDRVARRGVG